jgi:hypothetical protein
VVSESSVSQAVPDWQMRIGALYVELELWLEQLR